MFVTKIKGSKHEDFVKAKSELSIEACNKTLSAPVRATYAFGTKIGHTEYEVKRAFKNALRSLNEHCMLATGKPCATEEEMNGPATP